MLVLIFYAVIFIEVVVAFFCSVLKIQQSPYLSCLIPLFLTTTLLLWIQYDRKSIFGMALGFYMLIGWPFMFPIYILKSRGFRSGGLLLLIFFGLFIFTLISVFITISTIGIIMLLLGAV